MAPLAFIFPTYVSLPSHTARPVVFTPSTNANTKKKKKLLYHNNHQVAKRASLWGATKEPSKAVFCPGVTHFQATQQAFHPPSFSRPPRACTYSKNFP